jgi:hypothetical protein
MNFNTKLPPVNDWALTTRDVTNTPQWRGRMSFRCPVKLIANANAKRNLGGEDGKNAKIVFLQHGFCCRGEMKEQTEPWCN